MPEAREGVTLTRRAAVRSAAWSVPAVAVAAAAPVYAVSLGGQVVIRPGMTSVVQRQQWDTTYHDLHFGGFSIRIDGTPQAPATLTLTVEFIPDVPSSFGSNVYVEQVPGGWTSSVPEFDAATTVVLTFGTTVADRSIIPVTDGFQLVADLDLNPGTYRLTAAVPGLTPTVVTFATAGGGPVLQSASARRQRVVRSQLDAAGR